MFQKLKQRWGVNGGNLALIIITFALGGSLCGYAGRKLLLLANIDKGALWIVLYILLITLLWPVCVIIISVPLGQFGFFKKYLQKMWHKINGGKVPVTETATSRTVYIAIFASGAGSNAKKIIDYFKGNSAVAVKLIVCNNPSAGVLSIAKENGIDTLLIEKDSFFKGDGYIGTLKEYGIDQIILAGFLWKVPVSVIKAYPNKIINIHPALLPKYGGKGMYGHFVHEAVIAAKEKESGITIHYVDELYDHGQIIFQAKTPIADNDTADTLAQKIHLLEHEHYPAIIGNILSKVK